MSDTNLAKALLFVWMVPIGVFSIAAILFQSIEYSRLTLAATVSLLVYFVFTTLAWNKLK